MHLACISALTVLVHVAPVAAQPSLPVSAAEETVATPADLLGRISPRGLVHGYLDAVAMQDFDRAASYLDLSHLPENQRERRGARLARDLAQVLDRGGWVAPSLQLVLSPDGLSDDGLSADLDRVGGVRVDGETVDVLARRVASGVGRANGETPVWLFASETVAQVPSLLARIRPSWLDRTLPSVLADTSFRGAPAGHWLAIAILALVALAAGRLTMTVLAAGLRRMSARFRNGGGAALLEACLLPAGLIFATILFQVGSILFGTSVVARGLASRSAEIVGWVALAWLLWRIIDAFSRLGTARMAARNRNGAVSVVGLARRAAKAALVAVAVIAALDALNVDVTTGLAALGIGGLALALGAQKTIENFVGSLTLVVDQPIRVGDFCRFGDTLGTVEEIGMRSTQVRTLSRTVVTIPNGEFASMQIENYARRERFLFNPVLGLRYETSPGQIRRLLAQLRALLEDHPKVDSDPARVRFTGFGADNLAVEVFAYVHATDWNGYLAVQEDLNLAVMDIFAAEGIDFAFPSQTVYLARDAKAAARPTAVASIDREAA